MEQPFLPAEVSLLVLRYLAGIECKETARCFFKELPSLKEFIQSKNVGGQTPRGFEAPQVLGSLSDILFDYGRAKLIVKKLVVKLLDDWQALPEDSVSPCDTLTTQLRQIAQLMSTAFSRDRRLALPSSSNSNSDQQGFLPIPKAKIFRDAETQTKTRSQICNVAETQSEQPLFHDAMTQTKLPPITIIRPKRIASTCTTLDMPESQNIVVMNIKETCDGEAQTEQVVEAEPEAPVPVVFHLALTEPMEEVEEGEIEEGAGEIIPWMFYNDLLTNTDFQQQIANNINQQIATNELGNNGEEVVKAVSNQSENGIDNFLAELLQGEENSQGGFCYSYNTDVGFIESSETDLTNLSVNQPLQNEVQAPEPKDLSTPFKLLSAPAEAPQIPPSKEVPKASAPEVVIRSKAKPQPKRIKFVHNIPVPGQIQNSNTNSEVVTRSGGLGNSIALPNLSAWQALGRKSIVPKIPGQTTVPRTPTPATNSVLSVPITTPAVSTPQPNPQLQPKAQPAHPNIQLGSAEQVQVQPSVTNNKSAGPSASVCKEVGSAESDLPTNSQKKEVGKMSPFLSRLIASAHKVRLTTDLEKRSYSTPRKKKHVRNLLFTTPPNFDKNAKASTGVKNGTDKNENPSNLESLTKSLPMTRKRKADQTFESTLQDSEIRNPKSRKRLDWIEKPKAREDSERLVPITENPLNTSKDATTEPIESKVRSRSSTSKRQQCPTKSSDYSDVIETVIMSASMNTIANNVVNKKHEDTKSAKSATHKNKTSPTEKPLEKKVPKEKSKTRQSRSSVTATASEHPQITPVQVKQPLTLLDVRNASQPPRLNSIFKANQPAGSTQNVTQQFRPNSTTKSVIHSSRTILTANIDSHFAPLRPNLALNTTQPSAPKVSPSPALLVRPTQIPQSLSSASVNTVSASHAPLLSTRFIAPENTVIVPVKTQSSFIIPPSKTPVKISDAGSTEIIRQAPPTPTFLVNLCGESSWESNDCQISLNYENNGIYPTNLLSSSTPLRPGLPRTPGRFTPPSDEKSRSSCSSIFDTPDVRIYKDLDDPASDDLNTPVPKLAFYQSVQPAPMPSPAQVQRPRASSTSVTENFEQQQNCAISSTSQEIVTEPVPVIREKSVLRLNPENPTSTSTVSNQHRSIGFEVGGRSKKLTLSEEQTLYSLLDLRQSLESPNAKGASAPPQKTDKDPMICLLKNVNLDHFLTMVHGGRK